ncbi:fimbria/pilus outer membrane usher protein [Spirochaeta isovalerica]|uniref:Outer membrane usher protein n=1 Tax=Spirochaeta isovalerica TaxID=150 RepID=A0A841RAU3_9SPIO|nr:fimbria/pilus outer membrane usher protein [Spirochaeta isovalerica]MBB6481043.1 outer membrane usher protein [Spirochaeta isovalerica]
MLSFSIKITNLFNGFLLLTLLILFFPYSLSAQSRILLVNQAETEDIPALSELLYNMNTAFKEKMEAEVVFYNEDEVYIPIQETPVLLEKSRKDNISYLIINTFELDEDNITINSTALESEKGNTIFSLSSSGSISLGIERKLDFIINKINQNFIEEIESSTAGKVSKEIDKEDLFALVFGDPSGTEDQKIQIPILINGDYKGEISLYPEESADIKILYQQLLDYLSPLLTDDILAGFPLPEDPQEYRVSTILEESGIKSSYNSSELYLSISIPADMLKEQNLGVRNYQSPDRENLIEQSDFSFYLNLYHNQQWIWESIGADNTHSLPGSIQFNTAINFRNWIFTGDYTLNYPYQEEYPSLSIIHDFTGISSRLILGDFSVDNRGAQKFGRYQGISFARKPEITSADGAENPLFQFTLESPSFVRIFLNGYPVKSRQLPPGRFNLTDLPLRSGINEIRLSIEDSFGSVQEQEFLIPYASDGLSHRDIDYSASIGISPYSLELPLITGNFLYGFSFMTAGINIQSDFSDEMAGLSFLFPTRAGTFELEANQSWSSLRNSLGFSAALSYFFHSANNPRIPTFSLFSRYNSPAFFPVGSTEESPPDLLEIKGTLSYNLADFIYIQPGASFSFGREENGNSGMVSLGLRKKFSRNLSASMDFKEKFLPDGSSDFTVSLLIHINDYNDNQSLTVKSSNSQQGADISWKKRFQGANSSSLSAGISGLPFSGDTESTLSLRGSTSFNRFYGSLSSTLRSDGGNYTSYFQSRFETALVFADRHIALSRPITDSFAIVIPVFNLENLNVGINPRSDSYEFRSDFLGNPVVNNLRSYNSKKIAVNLAEPQIDIDTELGTSTFTLFPRYKSGTVIYTGTRNNVYITGRLVDGQGSALSFETGTLTDQEGEEFLFFTDREGVFFIYGLQRGECTLNINNSSYILNIQIPEETEKKLDLGDLKVLREDRS